MNGWTGGQYSVYRALLGGYLFVHFAMLLPFGGELFSSQGMLPDASTSPLTRSSLSRTIGRATPSTSVIPTPRRCTRLTH